MDNMGDLGSAPGAGFNRFELEDHLQDQDSTGLNWKIGSSEKRRCVKADFVWEF